MIVYRIGKTRFANDLTGEGARLFGGRWNHKLTPCIYTSESRALALLEYTANIHIDDIPRALSITTFEILTDEIPEISIASLPGNWMECPAPAETKDFGTNLFKKAAYQCYKIPSAIMPDEFNFIINPLFPAAEALRILEVRDFIYDVRLKI